MLHWLWKESVDVMKNNAKIAAYLTDILCSLLLATVINAALFALAFVETTLWGCFFATALALAFCVLSSRKWWIFPAVLVFAVAVLGLAAAFQPEENTVYDFLRGLFFGVAQEEDIAQAGVPFFALTILALPITAISFFYYRKVFFWGILPPVLLACVFALYKRQGSEHLVTIACLCIPVLLVSLAKATGLRIDAALVSEENLFTRLLPAFAVVFAPLIVMASLFLSPVDDGYWRVDAFKYFIDDLNDAAHGRTTPFASFGIKDTGFAPLGSRLGGNIKIDNTLVMTVTTNYPIRLGGAVYNGYDGKTWYDAGKVDSYRFQSVIWNSRRDVAFSLHCPAGGEEEAALYEKLTTNTKMSVDYAPPGNAFFVAGQLRSLSNSNSYREEIYFTSQGEVNSSRKRKSLYYEFVTTVFRRGMEGFDDNFLALEALVADDLDQQYDSVSANYLHLPDELPSSVYETAQAITAGLTSPYQKAYAIEAWLAQNCTYTLMPGVPPENTDFVEYFLNTRRGYCVYYASAMAVLARCEGLPSRFVMGYALRRNEAYPESPNSYVATNATAHAWTEIYFKGIGWVVFDPTDWNFQESTSFTAFQAPQVAASPEETPVPEEDSQEQLQNVHHALTPQEKATLIVVLAIIVLLCMFVLLRAVFLLSPKETQYKWFYRKYRGKMPEMLSACFLKLTRQAGFLGVTLKTGDTITMFARRLDERCGGSAASEACEAISLWLYALVEPTSSDVMRFCALNATLERRIKTEMKLLPYLFRRMLTGR